MRRGHIAVEAVIAVALLATATGALARFGQNASRLQQQADGRCAAMLAAENVLARIDGLPVAQVQTAAEQAAVEIGRESGCQVEIQVDDFSADGRDGVHVRVSVTPIEGHVLTLHDWAVSPIAPATSEAVQEPSDAN